MEESSSTAEIISGEKLEEEHYVEQDKTILDRLKQFSYYLVESIELNLDLCLNLLEERPVPTKPNSIPTTVQQQKKEITKDDFTKGVIYGNSNRNKIGVREGRSVKNDDMVWKTSKMYTKTGIVIPEDNAFYKNKDCHTEKYGHRRMFPWENLDLIKSNWERQDGLEIHNYILTGEEDLLNIVHDYVMTKNPYEEAKLEREKNHEELAADLQTKHEAVLSTFRGNFKEVLDELEEQYNIISGNHQENKELLVQVSQKQDDEKVLHIDIRRKLEKLTNQSIASSQNNREVLIVDHIQDIVKTETLNSMSDNLTEVIKEKLRENDPGPRINREFKRNLTQIKKLW
ncbi:hypothetical protein NQ317_002895 [Molorchus minor]|uniref:Uncharacterized protein n=1 Tax=Molorchus minor TaxID=1323400 RepID=A0ABQ9JR96_9CUCU|nr:hypothetical protein NQ317_002895 [Molorchus minor]